MARLIDISYFIGQINVPNAAKVDVGEELLAFVDKYESEFLEDVLGYPLAKAFTTGLAAGSPDAKWTDLLAGKEYTSINNKVEYWKGLRDSTKKTSPIANYVYYWWMRNGVTKTTSVGEVMPEGENSKRVSPARKMISAWNEMSERIDGLICFLEANKATYPEWDSSHIRCVLSQFRQLSLFNL